MTKLYVRLLKSFAFLSITWMITVPALAGVPSSSVNRFSAFLFVGGTDVNQPSVSQSFNAGGYRSTDCSFRPPDTTCLIRENSNVAISYPAVHIGAGWMWSERLGLKVGYVTSHRSTAYFANANSRNPLNDHLGWSARASAASFELDFLLLPYSGRKKIGIQLDVSGGCIIHSVHESLNMALPAADSLSNVASIAMIDQSGIGCSALFSFDAALFFGKHFSFTPFRLAWTLPAIQPSFGQIVSTNGTLRRVIPARNYDLSSLVWQVGLSVHW